MKRYDIECSGMHVHEEPDGDWVRWEDVEALIKERDEWLRLTKANEDLHAKRDVSEAKWIALACGHAPGDPYTTLTPERTAELLRDRLAEVSVWHSRPDSDRFVPDES